MLIWHKLSSMCPCTPVYTTIAVFVLLFVVLLFVASHHSWQRKLDHQRWTLLTRLSCDVVMVSFHIGHLHRQTEVYSFIITNRKKKISINSKGNLKKPTLLLFQKRSLNYVMWKTKNNYTQSNVWTCKKDKVGLGLYTVRCDWGCRPFHIQHWSTERGIFLQCWLENLPPVALRRTL